MGYDPTISGSRRAYLGKLATELPAKLQRHIIARPAAMSGQLHKFVAHVERIAFPAGDAPQQQHVM